MVCHSVIATINILQEQKIFRKEEKQRRHTFIGNRSGWGLSALPYSCGGAASEKQLNFSGFWSFEGPDMNDALDYKDKFLAAEVCLSLMKISILDVHQSLDGSWWLLHL